MIAKSMATAPYERRDVRYNLACVYAMTGRRTEALEMVKSLQGTEYIAVIRARRDSYFEALADDPEFLSLL